MTSHAKKSIRHRWPLLLMLLHGACSDLDPVVTGECGNLVVEASEQCDGAENCGSEGASACRFSCDQDTTPCPGDYGCSADGVCVATSGKFMEASAAPHLEMPADRIVVGDLDNDRRADLLGVGTSVRVRFGAPVAALSESYEKAIRQPTGAAAFGELDGKPGLDVIVPTADGVFVLVARGRTLEALPYATATALPDDSGRDCSTPFPMGWTACQRGDFNKDGRPDRAGFAQDHDNVLLQLGAAVGSIPATIDTTDVITDLAVGDFDGDGFDDIAISTRSANGVQTATADVIYGAPQPSSFALSVVATGDSYSGLAAADLDQPPDGIVDLALRRTDGIAVYRGGVARDLSAPFRLDGARGTLDVPFAVVAGEFVGGAGSGIDLMAYARNTADPSSTYFWWLRGLGGADLTVGAVDRVDATRLEFLERQWRVANVLADPGTGNGPDEVLGLSPKAPGCTGPALTVAVPSARFTATELLQSACLGVPGAGWTPELVGLTPQASQTVVAARRGESWWVADPTEIGSSLASNTLSGALTTLPGTCRDPQLWPEVRGDQTTISWLCEESSTTSIVALHLRRDGAQSVEVLATVPATATHLAGDYNGDGLTDIVIRDGRIVEVRLQCSTDMLGDTPGC